jgi:hypothetical protein
MHSWALCWHMSRISLSDGVELELIMTTIQPSRAGLLTFSLRLRSGPYSRARARFAGGQRSSIDARPDEGLKLGARAALRPIGRTAVPVAAPHTLKDEPSAVPRSSTPRTRAGTFFVHEPAAREAPGSHVEHHAVRAAAACLGPAISIAAATAKAETTAAVVPAGAPEPLRAARSPHRRDAVNYDFPRHRCRCEQHRILVRRGAPSSRRHLHTAQPSSRA